MATKTAGANGAQRASSPVMKIIKKDAASTAEGMRQLKLAMRDVEPDELKGLRANLGLPYWLVRPVLTFEATWAKFFLGLLSKSVYPLEVVILALLKAMPEGLRSQIMVKGFKFLVFLWSLLPKFIRSRGLADEMSTEAHFMSFLMWPARIFPMTLGRLRFAMTTVAWPNPKDPSIKEEKIDLPERGVKGIWLYSAPPDVKDPPVILWFFGGAFFAGDPAGNAGIAARYAKTIGADVFLADYRLIPENSIEDAFQDGCRAYEWLLTHKAPGKIVPVGISSGGGLVVRMLQLCRSTDEEVRKWAFYGTDPTPQPKGALLLGPFVNFQVPKPDDSMVKHCGVDMVVNQRVIEFCMPIFLESCGPPERLKRNSPLELDCGGLCPMWICYSLHEACTDDSAKLVRKLKAGGCKVEAFTLPYMSHVFQFLSAFLPEAQKGELAAMAWMKARMSEAD